MAMAPRKHARKGAPPPAGADLLRDLAALEAWNAARLLKERGMPEGWGDLARRLPARPARVRLSLALDPDVADWFQALCPDPAAGINAALRIYMLGVVSREIDAP
jgi:uncharacterized protein (DUF4415 family)